jgi:hypothetical protein
MVQLRQADDLVGLIEALTAHAYAKGYGTVAYFLAMALTEARLQLRREEEMDMSRSDSKRRLPEL